MGFVQNFGVKTSWKMTTLKTKWDGMVIFKKGFCRNGLCRWNVMKMAQVHLT